MLFMIDGAETSADALHCRQQSGGGAAPLTGAVSRASAIAKPFNYFATQRPYYNYNNHAMRCGERAPLSQIGGSFCCLVSVADVTQWFGAPFFPHSHHKDQRLEIHKPKTRNAGVRLPLTIKVSLHRSQPAFSDPEGAANQLLVHVSE